MGICRVRRDGRILWAALYGIWIGCLALPARALTLTEAYQSALSNDPFYKSEAAAAQAGMEEYNLGLSNLMPELSLNARQMDNRMQRDTYTNTNVLLSSEQRDYRSLGAGLYLRQPLFNLEKYAEYRKGKLQAAGAESQMGMGRQNAILRVTGVFFDAIIAGYEMELATARKNTVAAQAEQAAMFHDKGEATSSDEAIVQSKLELASIQQNEISDNRSIKVGTLAQLTARDVDTLPAVVFDDSQVGQEPESPVSLDQWLEQALAQNLELIQKQQAAELAENETKKYASSYLPSVDLVANVTRNNQDSFTTLNQDIRNRSVGIELNWQLFKGGASNAAVRQTLAKAEQARQDVAAAKLRLKLEVEHQYRSTVTGRMKLHALSQAVKTQGERIKSAELLFKAGVRTSIDVLSAQADLSQTKKEYSEALKEYVLARFRLRALIGSLGDEDIGWVEKYLQVLPFREPA